MDPYYKKYLKYKKKYMQLKNGGSNKRKLSDIENIDENPKAIKLVSYEKDNLEFFFNFNTRKEKIMEYYKNFKKLDLINLPIERIGQSSNNKNGIISKIIFENKDTNNKFDTILKTSIKKNSDNNYYEYVVGNCINDFKKYYPNFIYTFGYFNIKDNLKNELKKPSIDPQLFKDKDNVEIKEIPLNELQNNKNIGNGCENNDKASVLIEFIPNSITLEELFKNKKFIDNVDFEAFNILFQLYATLSSLKKVFTHYDLHINNVMFIEIPDDKIIKIDYHMKDNSVFPIYTSFIPVILDYGRSYVDCSNYNDTIFSKVFSEVSCNNEKCNFSELPACDMQKVGLIFEKSKNDIYSEKTTSYYINPRKKNESIDLLYLHSFMIIFKKNFSDQTQFEKLYNHVNKTFWINTNGNLINGVKEDLTLGVLQCFEWLKQVYNYNNFYEVNSLKDKQQYGNMTIYCDQKEEWKFTKI
jgi:hypothetical protein